MTELLEPYGTENRLLKSIPSDLKTIKFIAGVKALGLIYLLITSPLRTVLEDPNITITDINDKYFQLVTFLDDSSKNVRNFMTGQLFTFGEDTYIEKGPIFDALMR